LGQTFVLGVEKKRADQEEKNEGLAQHVLFFS
jgi:hypothetical protein